MKRVLLGFAAAALAAASAAPACAQTKDDVIALVRDVCLAHGGDLPAVATMARQAGWRPLDLNALEAANEPIFRSYWRTGWATGEGANAMRLVLGVEGAASPAFESHAATGAMVAPPAAAPAPDGGVNPGQVCILQFQTTQTSALVRDLRELVVFEAPLGEANKVQDGPATPEAASFWGARYHNEVWIRGDFSNYRVVNLVVTPENAPARSRIFVNMPRAER